MFIISVEQWCFIDSTGPEVLILLGFLVRGLARMDRISGNFAEACRQFQKEGKSRNDKGFMDREGNFVGEVQEWKVFAECLLARFLHGVSRETILKSVKIRIRNIVLNCCKLSAMLPWQFIHIYSHFIHRDLWITFAIYYHYHIFPTAPPPRHELTNIYHYQFMSLSEYSV